MIRNPLSLLSSFSPLFHEIQEESTKRNRVQRVKRGGKSGKHNHLFRTSHHVLSSSHRPVIYSPNSPSKSYDGTKKSVPVIAVLKSSKRSVLPAGLPINIFSNIRRVVLNVLAYPIKYVPYSPFEVLANGILARTIFRSSPILGSQHYAHSPASLRPTAPHH